MSDRPDAAVDRCVVRLPDSVHQLGIHLCVSVGAALLVFLVPSLRTPRRLLVVGFVALAILLRGAFPAYLLLCAATYVFAVRVASLREANPAARWRLFATAIVFLATVFVLGRAWQAQRHGAHVLGVPWTFYYFDMWMLLRLVSFLWETGSGRVRAPAPRSFALWSLLPFTMSGPLLRFHEFDQQLGRIGAVDATQGFGDARWWQRVALAVVQLAGGVLVGLAMPWSDAGGAGRALVRILVLAPWGFYLLTAGTMTLMECLSRAWGLVLPRSFDRAFGRPNISEFWAHWNMSATSMFRDYLFYNRWGRRTVNVYANVLVLFVLVGLWHDSNAYWILWGLLHGIGFATFLYYKKWRAAHPEVRILTLPRPVAIAATYLFVCACWAAPPQIIKLASRLA